MKSMVLSLMVMLMVIGVAAPMVGGTFASFSDIEISRDNYIETGDLDLKVNGNDDPDVGTFFEIAEGKICTTYASSPSPIPLWNEGSVHGPLYLHIKNLVGPNSLSQNVNMEIRYDGSWVISGSIYDLACQQIELGQMPGDGIIEEVIMELHATAGASGERLTFDIAFELFGGCAFSDIETSRGNYFMLKSQLGGTPGWWQSKAAVKQYGKSQIADWFRDIVLDSPWFENSLAGGSDDKVYAEMVGILGKTSGPGYEGKLNRFRSQYLATRLNTMPDSPRLGLDTSHDITSVPRNGGYIDASDYFGFDIGTLQQIIDTIESKAKGDIFTAPPSQEEILIMKDVCDALNNVEI